MKLRGTEGHSPEEYNSKINKIRIIQRFFMANDGVTDSIIQNYVVSSQNSTNGISLEDRKEQSLGGNSLTYNTLIYNKYTCYLLKNQKIELYLNGTKLEFKTK